MSFHDPKRQPDESPEAYRARRRHSQRIAKTLASPHGAAQPVVSESQGTRAERRHNFKHKPKYPVPTSGD